MQLSYSEQFSFVISFIQSLSRRSVNVVQSQFFFTTFSSFLSLQHFTGVSSFSITSFILAL
jgi:hypothetical protein